MVQISLRILCSFFHTASRWTRLLAIIYCLLENLRMENDKALHQLMSCVLTLHGFEVGRMCHPSITCLLRSNSNAFLENMNRVIVLLLPVMMIIGNTLYRKRFKYMMGFHFVDRSTSKCISKLTYTHSRAKKIISWGMQGFSTSTCGSSPKF